MVDCKTLTAVGALILAMATIVGSARAGSAPTSDGQDLLAKKDGGALELTSKEAGVEFAKDGGVLELAKEAGYVELATDK